MALAMPIPTIESPMGDFAQWYAAFGLPVCPALGKAPKITKNGYYDATTDPAQITAWWQEYPYANIAIRMGGLWWTLDVDVHNGGAESLEALLRDHDDLPRTVTSETGSQNGSVHMLWRVPEGVVIPTCKPWKGIDVQGDPSCIIVPPSLHPETMKRYQWRQTLSPADLAPVEAPEWLVELVLQQAANKAEDEPLDPQSTIYEGERETRLTKVGGAMRRHGANEAEIRAAFEAFNQRMEPPLPAKDLDRVARSMARYRPADNVTQLYPNSAAPGFTNMGEQQTAANDAPAPTPAAWMKDLFTYKGGELKQNAYNIGQILRLHPYWHMPERKLWYDVIRGYHMSGPDQISKALATKATQWFGGQMRLAISNIDLLKLCMESQAADNHVDLLAAHLLALRAWDRKPRLESWLCDVTGAEDNAYTRYLSRALPVSMVARVMQPGCPCRLVVILEGKENIGKSHLVEAIATQEWYTILSMSLEGKDSHIMLHKYWVAELAELDSLSRTEEARMKAFVTMETDTYVPKYSNVSVSIPRRTIFMGTTNDASGYLKGQSGNTRYYPLKVGDRINVDMFRAIREQVFAEAIVWHSENQDTWWQEPSDVTARANEERELRRQASDFEQPLHEWLEYARYDDDYYDNGKLVRFTKNETSWPEIARHFLKIDAPERWKDRSLQMQIASALKALGWTSTPVWRFGRNTRIWTLPEPGETTE